ncbi:MAG: hypothetical protein WA294_12405 [Acidobacteriaceae bacterium]
MPAAEQTEKRERAAVLSLEVLARAEPAEANQPTQFATLVRHFFERFFTSEMASQEGDAKTRLVQAACAIGVPGLVLALYLYTPYHLPHIVRSYWDQAGDHYFYVLYSLTAMGLVTLFEWDLFFPDLLDVFVLSSLPVRSSRLFRARVTAIFILSAAAIFDANFLAVIVLPAAIDPPHLFRFLAAHIAAVGLSGLFGAAGFLALEGMLLALLGDRLFRRISLVLQGIAVMALLTALFAYGAVSGALHGLLQSGNPRLFWFPPLWFLGIYQRILDGPATPPVLAALARTGLAATAIAIALACATYPLAWWRRTKDLLEGAARRDRQNLAAVPAHGLLHHTLVPRPESRAVWHFIGQNLLRVPRYRMVLVMYGGAGAALVFAAVMRMPMGHGHIGLVFSPDGLRAAIPIVAFWTVSGLRSTFLAPADQRGRWVFRVASGKPGLPHVQAARRWVLMWTLLLTLGAAAWACIAEPLSLHTLRFATGQVFMAIALSVLLTDAFFLSVKTIPFTGAKPNSAANFALLLIPYLGFFPAIVMFTIALEPVFEATWAHLAVAAGIACFLHGFLLWKHRALIAGHLQQIDADDDEEDFPLRLGLRC